MLFKSLAVAAAVGTAVAQRPMNTSICDYYTTALLKNNTAANQMTLLTLVVNTAVIGNYTKPNVGIKVAGILAAGEVDGEQVNLLPYFSGGLLSTNTGGMAGRSVNFLDGGGAAPLMQNKPANDESSRQYTLLTHLYEYFGTLLGCSQQGSGDYPAYNGGPSMYEVHKFMGLGKAEITYFIQQVGMSAASFGVADDDVTTVGKALTAAFAYRCAPEVTIIKSQGDQLQSICIDSTCDLSPNAVCDKYAAVVEPQMANSTMGGNSTSTATSGSASSTATGGSSGSGGSGGSGGSSASAGSGGASGTSSSTPATQSGSATIVGMSFAAAAAGVVAFFL